MTEGEFVLLVARTRLPLSPAELAMLRRFHQLPRRREHEKHVPTDEALRLEILNTALEKCPKTIQGRKAWS